MELKPIIPINLNVDQTNYYWFKEGFSLDEIKSIEDISTDFPFEEQLQYHLTLILNLD